MEEDFNNRNKFSKIKPILDSKQFLAAIILLAIIVAGNEISNIIRTYYEARASLTFSLGFIHIIYEWYRGLVYLIIVFGLVSFIVKYRNNQTYFTQGLNLI